MKKLLFVFLFLGIIPKLYAQSNCVGSVSMIASPTQPPGGYAPGTTVDICITITDYTQFSATWIHGLGINFGPGWDTGTINPYSPANSCDGFGAWSWYNSCSSIGSGLTYGPGFYYDSPQGSPGGAMDGLPGNNFGDNCQFFSWEFCLTIEASSFSTVNIPLTGSIRITSDGITGSWTNNGCGVNIASFNSLLSGSSCGASFFYLNEPVVGVPFQLFNVSSALSPSYQWNFGDGGTATTINPVHTYVQSGLYPICLTVIDTTGCSDTLCTNVNVFSNFWSGVYPYSITGTVYYDVDSNGVRDLFEPGLEGQELNLQPANNYITSQTGGDYNFPVFSGNYVVSAPVIPGWTLSSDSSLFHVHVDSITGSQSGYEFGFKPDSFYSGMELNFIPGSSNCNSYTQQFIGVHNTGTNFNDGVISYLKHDSVTIIQTLPPADSVVQDMYYWHYTHLAPTNHELVVLTVDKPNTIGYQFENVTYADIRDSVNNIISSIHDTVIEDVTCSYDPNEKIVEPVKFLWGQNYTLIGQQLTYTIYFQNTGNAPAQNVAIVDTLNSNLDPESFSLVAFSHPVVVHIESSGIVTFLFNGINLPDSVSNEPGSHGFVQFTIDAIPGIQNNTLVENTAYIYFDQNAPIQTPAASTTFVIGYPLSVQAIENNGGISIFPNPATDKVTIQSQGLISAGDYLELIDATGKLCIRKSIHSTETIDLTGFSKGVYCIRIIQQRQSSEFRLVIQ